MKLSTFVSAGLLLGLSISVASGQVTKIEIKTPLMAQGAEADGHFQLPARGYYAVRSASPDELVTLDAQAAAGSTIPLWNSSVTSLGSTYKYKMVGKNPAVAHTSQTSKVPSPVVPIIFNFQSGGVTVHTFDPTAADPVCSPAGSAFSLTLASPLLKNHAYTAGGTSIGTTQYVDFFQRANFYKYTKPTGVNPKYHVLLTPSTPVGVVVTANNFPIQSAPCGELGFIEYNSWDNYLQTQIFPQLATYGITPTTFPIFEFYNVVLYDTTISNCCILGYHGNFTNGAFQTYAISDFDTSGAFSGSSDISGMSHEIAEWMNDPTGANPTPAWGHIGQVSGCQGNLEVGDPLSGTIVTVTMPNGYHYHPQELAFFSWFYRQSPSIGVNGWYSSHDTFTTSAGAVCH